jgi:transcriptional regulator GlxA family with amidase domain
VIDGNDNIRANTANMSPGPPEIGILIYPGAQIASVLGLTDLLTVAEGLARKKVPKSEAALLSVSHWQQDDGSEAPRRVLETTPSLSATPTVLLIPPSLGDPIERSTAQQFAPWLRSLHDSGATLASVCGGALLLGESGLLDGRPATTHWSYGELMRSRFPKARVDTDRLIIEDGDIVTAGGVMAWTDLGLKLVERYLGPTVMMETARLLLVDPPGREQRYYSTFSPNLTHGDAAVLKLQHWLQATGAKDINLRRLSELAGLEERTLLRRFRAATGFTTTEYAQRLRVGKAQELLQFQATPADSIAWEVGYQDPSAFRRVFRRVVGLTPAEYRRRFRA